MFSRFLFSAITAAAMATAAPAWAGEGPQFGSPSDDVRTSLAKADTSKMKAEENVSTVARAEGQQVRTAHETSFDSLDTDKDGRVSDQERLGDSGG
jgi:hypothetical protein